MRTMSFYKSALLIVALATATTACLAKDATKAALSVARVQLLAQQLSGAARDAAGGDIDAFSSVERLRNDIADRLALLKRGDLGDAYSVDLDAAWTQLSADAGKVLDNREQVLDAANAASDFSSRLPVLNAHMDEAEHILVDHQASATQVMITSRQILLVVRMQRRVASILQGGEESESAADGLQRDAALYDVVLTGLLKGKADLEIKALDDADARVIVEKIKKEWTELTPARTKLLGLAPHVQAAKEAADKAAFDCQKVIAKADALIRRLEE